MTMEFEKKHRKLIRENYTFLAELGIPSEILDNLKNWLFFLQEGFDFETGWNYLSYLSSPKIIELYWFLKNNEIEFSLAYEIEFKFDIRKRLN